MLLRDRRLLGSLNTAAMGGTPAPFTPLSLFGSGEQGGIWDATDPANIKLDASNASSADGKVGYLADLSPNANHLEQGTDANRPTRRDGASKSYLEFSRAATTRLSKVFATSQPWHRITAFRPTAHDNNARVWGPTSGNSGFLLQSTSVANGYQIWSGALLGTPAKASGADAVAIEKHNGANSLIQFSGDAGVTGNAGTTSLAGVILGADFGGNAISMRYYRSIMINRILSAEEEANAIAWCAAGYA